MDRLTVHEMIDAIKKNYPPPQYSMLLEALGHAVDLMKAEAEGRLLVPPCKVGDTVYLRDLTPCKVVGINIGYYTRTVTIEFNDGGRIPNWQPRGFNEFGVSVFTTREAAEAALKGGDDHV